MYVIAVSDYVSAKDLTRIIDEAFGHRSRNEVLEAMQFNLPTKSWALEVNIQSLLDQVAIAENATLISGASLNTSPAIFVNPTNNLNIDPRKNIGPSNNSNANPDNIGGLNPHNNFFLGSPNDLASGLNVNNSPPE